MEYINKFTFSKGKYAGKTVYVVTSDPNNEFFKKSSYKEFIGEEIEFEDKKFKIIGVEHIRPFIPRDFQMLGFMVNEIKES